MKREFRKLAAIAVGVILTGPCGLAADGYVLKDHLNRSWQNEVVSFPLSKADLVKANAGKALAGPDGKPVPYQMAGDRIVFPADLGPFETRTYAFAEGPRVEASDLVIEETPETIRLLNGRTGIALRRNLGVNQGPVESVRLASGVWVGGSRFDTKQKLVSYTAEITARGPVYAEVLCRVAFQDGQQWTGIFRLQAGEPVVLVEEQFDVKGDSSLVLSLGRGFDPTEIFWRPTALGKTELLGETPEAPLVFRLQPWSQWGPTRMGKWFGLFGEKSGDLLFLGARDGDLWVDLRRPHDASVRVEQTADDVVARFALEDGRRKWMIGSLPKAECLAGIDKPFTPLPQEQVIKHEFPLDRIKDYILEWEGNEAHPRLYITPEEVAKRSESFQSDPAELARLIKTPVNTMEFEPWVKYYLLGKDPALGRHLADTAVQWMQRAVDMQLRQVAAPWLGRAPHGQTDILTAMNLADAVLAGNDATAEEKQRLRSQAAFLAYTLMREDYWSPLRGFAANPNMTSHVSGYLTVAGCLVASHPESKTWITEGLRELKDVELDTWMDDNGGWLEAPGYAMVSWNYMLGAYIAARNSGFPDHVSDANAKKLVGWFSKISTPPDSRLGGARHVPPIGHTWKLAWCGEFGLVASLWKESDPELAADMAWMHKEHNSYTRKVGGFTASMSGYRDWALTDLDGIEPKAPGYGSEIFPETGALLRSHFPSDRETMLYMIAGENGHHYDYDSGSVTIWGKGRIVSDEFGYYGRAPVEDHSMVEVPLLKNLAMRIKDFSSSPHFDYVRGSVAKGLPGDESRLTELTHLDYQHAVYNDWIRQIAFVKDDDPLGPNYFVISDSLRTPIPATWRMWFDCEKILLKPQAATVIGKEDVDTDVFFARPDPVVLTTEEKTRKTHGFNEEIKYGLWEWTQTGLIASEENGLGFTTVIFPRLKTEAAPKFTSLDGGRVVKIESPAGTDYVFLAAKSFNFREGDISFQGTSGSIQKRGDRVILALGAAGRIAGHGLELESGQAASKDSAAKTP